ncbi:MAG: ferrous iron transport protein B [Anaerolineales bacterium]|nr:MAG: ferrous iron transport protein B [Anaerolineales bacterium]
MAEHEGNTIRVALAGQPNVGKSTVFNLLTGLNQRVGNWPGKTVEQKAGTCNIDSWTLQVVDLPGTYSLSANSPEELIAREYIIKEKPDVVVAIVNAATLERSLYLVAELLPLPTPVIVGLNMIDVAEQQGLTIEPRVLEAAMGVPVVPMVAARGQGIHDLLARIEEVTCDGAEYTPNTPNIRADHVDVLERIEELIGGHVPAEYPTTWVALKILEGDQQITDMIHPRLPQEAWSEVYQIIQQHEDTCVAVAGGRYAWIARMVRAAVVKPRIGPISLTDRLDRWATHPVWGLLVLVSILALSFALTYAIGSPLQELLHRYLVQNLADLAVRALDTAPTWLTGLLVDGVIGGVGAVLTFFPILVIFFAVLGILEDIGYMARAAYVMDRFMHLMGLHGKSFLPLFLGFGCNVPAVMGTRVIESQRARLLTIIVSPLVPCTARMGVIAFLAPAFFAAPAIVSWALLATNLAVLVGSGLLLNRFILKGEQVAFIMELPLYHLPNWHTIAITVWHRLLSFLRRAGTVILAVSIVIWMLSTFPGGDPETSVLASVGRLVEPVGMWMGLDWRMMLALISSFVAKENAVATMGVLFGVGESGAGLPAILRNTLSPSAGLAFLVTQMLFVPCVSTVATIKQESDSWGWTLFSVLFLLVVSLAGGVVAYQAARLLGW